MVELDYYSIENADEDMITLLYHDVEDTDVEVEYATFLRGIGEYTDADYLAECYKDLATRKI